MEYVTLKVKVDSADAKLNIQSVRKAVTDLQTVSSKPITISVKTSGANASIFRDVDESMGQLDATAVKTGDTFTSLYAKIAKWGIMTSVVYGPIKAFREALTTLKAVDTEMVNVQKVTDYSNTQMKELEENAYSLASAYGRTADEIASMYTTFARAGYLGGELDSMTELGTLLANIGDISQDTASKFLLAVDAAWKLNGSESELMTVMDGLNEITNKNAVDMEGLTSGITVAGSVFAEAGESVQTFSALVGAGIAATQRSGSEISRGLRTIIMNIRQIKGELEDGELVDGESIAKASETLKKYAGISTMANGQLRESSAVLGELAGKWETLDTVAQSAIAEALAGKRQANILTALMGHWDTVEKMMQDYADGAGSALKENEIYLDSWEAKSKQLTASWTEFVSHLVETDTIKGALDVVIGLVELLDSEGGHLIVTIGGITAAVLLLGQAKKAVLGSEVVKDVKAAITAINALKEATIAYAAAKEAAAAKNHAAESALTFLEADKSEGAAKGLGKLGTAILNLGLSGGQLGLIAAGIAGLVVVVKTLADANDKANRSMSDFDTEIGETNEQLQANKERLDEINSTPWNERSAEIIKEKNALEAENEALQEQVELLQKQKLEKAQNSTGEGFQFGFTKDSEAYETILNYLDKYTEQIERTGQVEESQQLAFEKTTEAAARQVEMLQYLKDNGQTLTSQEEELIEAYERLGSVIPGTTDAMAEYVSGLVEEAQQAGKTEKELYDLVAAQITASDTKLNFSQQIMALQQLAAQAGYAGNALANTFALAGINETNVKKTAAGLMQTGNYSSYEEAYAEALRRTQESMLYQFGKLTSTAPSGGWGGSSSGGTYKSDYTDDSVSKKKEQEAEKLANARKKAAQATIDAIKKQRDAETDAIDEQIDSLKKQNEETERGEKLEELKLNILKRQDELLNARNERTVRQYNAATGQWEWVADAQKVKDAEDALEDAKKDLRDYERDTERELAIEELEARKKAIEAAYRLKIDTWQKLIDELNGDVETEAALLAASRGDWETYYQEMLKVYQKLLDAAQDYEDKKQEIQNSSNTGGGNNTGGDNNNDGDDDDTPGWKPAPSHEPEGTKTNGSAGNASDRGMSSGQTPNAPQYEYDGKTPNANGIPGATNTESGLKPSGNDNKNSSTTTGSSGNKKGNTLGGGKNINKVSQYDSGGVLHGLGGIKATVDDEMVLPPDVTRKLLTPSSDSRAMEVIAGMRMALNDRTPYGRSLAGVTNNSTDSHDVSYCVNGVPISADMAKLPMEQIVRQLNMAAFQGQVFNGW